MATIVRLMKARDRMRMKREKRRERKRKRGRKGERERERDRSRQESVSQSVESRVIDNLVKAVYPETNHGCMAINSSSRKICIFSIQLDMSQLL